MTHESPQLARVRQARAALLLTHPFFGVLSLKLALKETQAIPTAGVNTREMVFNPAFVDTLSGAELKGLIAHEVMHLALGHQTRQGLREHGRWNQACDYALNLTIIDDGFTLPPDGLVDPKYRGMSAEAIYEKLPKQSKPKRGKGKPGNGTSNPGQGQPDDGSGEGDEPAWGTFDSAGPEGSAEAQESAREWAENAAEAVRAAKSAGKLPAHIARTITEALAPRADWRSLLRRFMTDQVRTSTTWSRRNKRFPGVYLPGKLRDGMGEIVIGVDTSGSIDSRTLTAFGAEIRSICADVAPAMVRVVYCDAAVNHVDSFEYGEDVTLTPHGGGGTDFRPVFERVAASGWTPAACVYLTDLMGTFPDAAPEYPTLWASYGAGDAAAPWGETVRIDG